MVVFSFIVSAIILSKLKNRYYFYKLNNSNTFMWSLFGLTIATYVAWPFVFISYFFLKGSGVLDKMASGNLKRRQEAEILERFKKAEPKSDVPHSKYYQYQYRETYFNSSSEMGLPESPKKREKIIKKFNKEYALNLTSHQIENIVNVTYASREWANELKMMERSYVSPYEWMMNGPYWLRIYMTAFPIMDIVPDYKLQEDVVIRAFDEVFTYGCGPGNLPLEVVVENINTKFLTKFDDVTFLRAVEYMKSKGKEYSFATSVMDSVNTQMYDLESKYDRM